MSIKLATPLSIDFCDKKYVSINAKQYDTKSRFILVTCLNKGKIFSLDKQYHAAYVRYRKADELGVFNRCEVTNDGKVLVELTEQMLSVAGNCYADLVIISKNSEIVKLDDLFDFASSYENGVVTLYPSDFIRIEEVDDNALSIEIKDLGEIITGGKYSVLSTMTFIVNVVETSLDNIEIESSYEFNALNDALIKSIEDYDSVVTACAISEKAAKLSERMANIYEENSKNYSLNAKASEENAKASEDQARISEENTKISETNAEIHANTTMTKALEASEFASVSSENAQISIDKATEASDYSILAKSYAVGETGTRIDEDIDNSKYYYTQTKTIRDNINGSFKPMGTILFSELQSVEKDTSYTYHISDSFVTDDTFKCGAGVSYPAGTNVYYTADGYWDCFSGRFITDEDFEAINQTIAELLKRIEALEGQTVLEVNE